MQELAKIEELSAAEAAEAKDKSFSALKYYMGMHMVIGYAEEDERQRIAHEAEQKRLEDEARAADFEHRRTINNDAVASMMANGISEDCAKAVITQIAKGNIYHVKMEY